MPTYKRTFPGRAAELRKARSWTRAILNGSPRADDAATVVTELAANAVLHTASGSENGTFHVRLTHSGEAITLSVADRGGTDHLPHVETASDNATHGRGLALVTAIADTVECFGDKYGRTVTATFTTEAPEAETSRNPAGPDRASTPRRALWLDLRSAGQRMQPIHGAGTAG